MPGPKTDAEARAWIQDAILSGRYTPAVHFRERLAERKLDMDDVFTVAEGISSCFSYVHGKAEHGGTCWRVIGKIDAGTDVALGVEAYLDDKKRRCVLCTIFRTTSGE